MTILITNPRYDILTDVEKAKICNGAGAANDWRSVLIPNTILGLDCTEAFNIHDYDYHIGVTQAAKVRADANMLANLIRLINTQGGLLAYFRRYRAVTYYTAVHSQGSPAFFTQEKLDRIVSEWGILSSLNDYNNT